MGLGSRIKKTVKKIGRHIKENPWSLTGVGAMADIYTKAGEGVKKSWTDIRTPLAYAAAGALLASGVGAGLGAAGMAGLAGTTTGAMAASGAITGATSGAAAGLQANEANKANKEFEEQQERQAQEERRLMNSQSQEHQELSSREALNQVMKKSALARVYRTAGQARSNTTFG